MRHVRPHSLCHHLIKNPINHLMPHAQHPLQRARQKCTSKAHAALKRAAGVVCAARVRASVQVRRVGPLICRCARERGLRARLMLAWTACDECRVQPCVPPASPLPLTEVNGRHTRTSAGICCACDLTASTLVRLSSLARSLSLNTRSPL